MQVLSVDGAGAELLVGDNREVTRGVRLAPAPTTRERWVANRTPCDTALVILRDPRDLVALAVDDEPYSDLEHAVAELRPDQQLIARTADLRSVERVFRSWAAIAGSAQEQLVLFEDFSSDVARLVDAFDRLGVALPDDDVARIQQRLDAAKGEAWTRVGLWRDRFDRSTGRLFEAMFPSLLTDLGVETSRDWWQELSGGSPDDAPSRPSLFGDPAEPTPFRKKKERRPASELGLFGRRVS